jgi:hypothetical protein
VGVNGRAEFAQERDVGACSHRVQAQLHRRHVGLHLVLGRHVLVPEGA